MSEEFEYIQQSLRDVTQYHALTGKAEHAYTPAIFLGFVVSTKTRSVSSGLREYKKLAETASVKPDQKSIQRAPVLLNPHRLLPHRPHSRSQWPVHPIGQRSHLSVPSPPADQYAEAASPMDITQNSVAFFADHGS